VRGYSAATVRAAARAVGPTATRPNAAARGLRTSAARSVALIVPDVTNRFFGHVMRGPQPAAWDAGYAAPSSTPQRPRVGDRLL
jgi:DNA-binding LacI/PurR family transcriptional regulator